MIIKDLQLLGKELDNFLYYNLIKTHIFEYIKYDICDTFEKNYMILIIINLFQF